MSAWVSGNGVAVSKGCQWQREDCLQSKEQGLTEDGGAAVNVQGTMLLAASDAGVGNLDRVTSRFLGGQAVGEEPLLGKDEVSLCVSWRTWVHILGRQQTCEPWV